MIQVVTKEMFIQAFADADRMSHFSREGLGALFDFLESTHDLDGSDFKLDVIEICCDFTEDSISLVLSQYGLDTIEDLRDSTCVIDLSGGFVIYGAF